jgi:hypothetical protein
MRLPLAATLTVVFLIIFLSPGAQSESGASIGIAPATCAADLLRNGAFEEPEVSAASPYYWTTGQWRPGAYFIRDTTHAHSGFQQYQDHGAGAW